MKHLGIWILVGLLCFGGLAVSGAPVAPGGAALFTYLVWVVVAGVMSAAAVLAEEAEKSGGGS